MRDYYEILMVHEKAIPEVIERVYRYLARKYHPDVHPPEQRLEAQRRMTELNLAYQVLSDARKRAEYDQQRRLGIFPGREIHLDGVSVESLLKCFNHPQRPAAAFCWDCGRPICGQCIWSGPALEDYGSILDPTRTICVTCVRRSTDLETRIRAGRRANPHGRWYERPMGTWGALLYYSFVGTFGAALCAVVFLAAREAGVHWTLARLYAGVVAGLYVLLIAYRLFTRVRCPNCNTDCGRLDFRRIAPWKDILSPHPVCHHCGRHFLKQEVADQID
ncbi:MAG: DnaJ domain-containing protein [Candidatus Zipacnadales bacterium]